MNPKNMSAAAECGHRVHFALHQALEPFVDEMDEDDSDDVLEPQIIGLLVGLRAFIGQATGLEAHLVKLLEPAGFTRERYASIVALADAAGLAQAQAMAQELFREEPTS